MSPRARLRHRLSTSLLAAGVLALCAGSTLACSSLPARPVPRPDGKPKLPFPMPQPEWTKSVQQEVYKEGKVVFDTGKATIRADAIPTLERLLTYLQQNPKVSRIRLEGHTDFRASDDYNNKLAERRAIAVANWLVDKGLDHNRILAVAFGEARPLWPNNLGRTAWQENRRTEFHVAEINGNRFRGKDPANGGLVLHVMSKAERDALAAKGTIPTAPPPVKVNPEGHIIKNVAKPTLKGKLLPSNVDAVEKKKDDGKAKDGK